MKSYVLLLVLSGIFISMGTAKAQTTQAQQSAKLNHIAVYVSDLDKSGSFYEELLNLKKIEEPFKDGKHIWFSMAAAGQMHLIKGEQAKMEHNKNEHLCFSVSLIDEFIAKLNERHIPYEDWAGKAKATTVRVDGVKQVYFKDPDGHWLEVNDAL